MNHRWTQKEKKLFSVVLVSFQKGVVSGSANGRSRSRCNLPPVLSLSPFVLTSNGTHSVLCSWSSLWPCRRAAALCCEELRHFEPQTTSRRIKVQRRDSMIFFSVFKSCFLKYLKSLVCVSSSSRTHSVWNFPLLMKFFVCSKWGNSVSLVF